MTKYMKVDGLEMVRDMSNMSLINTDKNELESYLTKRKILLEQKDEINSIKKEVSNLQADISTIKNLLIQLTNR